MLEELKNFVLDILFPKCCLGCDDKGGYLCSKCCKKIRILENQSYFPCKFFDRLIAGCRYEGLIKKILWGFKFGFVKELVKILGEILKAQFVYFSQTDAFLREAVFVPVPLHKRRIFYRGFNQNLKLAEYLRQSLHKDADLQGIFHNFLFDCLIKTQNSQPQNELKRTERLINLKGKILLKKEFVPYLRDKHIVLIDDVATTGATLTECAKALKTAHVRSITALVVARA